MEEHFVGGESCVTPASRDVYPEFARDREMKSLSEEMRSPQTGFTLVEIGIVLVIITVLLGGILKGREMITQARIKSVVGDFSGATAAYLSYQDRYQAIPGDDPNAATRWASWGTPGGNGNGYVGGGYESNAPSDESRKFWWHLRAAGLVPGPTQGPGADTQPNNAVEGIAGVQTNGLGLPGLIICVSNVPDKVAGAVDAQLDDHESNGGNMRAFAHTGPDPREALGATVAAAYTDGAGGRYILCRTM
jgi:type II secretory pathway pseudopilin PulG